MFIFLILAGKYKYICQEGERLAWMIYHLQNFAQTEMKVTDIDDNFNLVFSLI